MTTFLQNIFSVKNDDIHKVVTIFCIKFKIKSKKLINRMGIKRNSVLEDIFSIKNSSDRRHKIVTVLGIKLKIKRKHKNIRTNNIYNWEKFPKALPVKTNKIAFIIEDTIPQCKLYRVTNKLEAFKKLGYEVEVVSWRDEQESLEVLQLAEFVIFYRVPFFDNVKKYYKEADRLGIKKIFDIDDLIFEYDLYFDYLKNQKIVDNVKQEVLNGVDLYLRALKNADEVWVSTETLEQITKKYNPNVKIIPNCIPDELLTIEPVKTKDKVKIFYGSGSDTHNTDFLNCFNALECILNKYENVELYIHGHLDTDIFSKNIQNKIHKIDFIEAKDYYFATSNYDIALAPLAKCVFSDAKSNIKFIEAAMLEIPIIASGAKEFINVIQNGVNGYIANTKEEWINALSVLVENPELRNNVGRNAKETALKLYGQEANCNYIKNAIQDTVKQNNENKNKKKALFVNILYGYSSFGGATIVAEKIAENFNKYEDWESYVFSCHMDSKEDVLVRYDWQNVPIFSSSILGVSLDYENKTITENFKKVLDIVKPDIIHLHCIQTIGVDIIDVIKEYNIPYTITMHDAWFSCAKQFMLDKENKFCNQFCASPEICKTRCDISHKDFYKRKHKLYNAIKDASFVCTPTEIFNKQIEQNFPNIKLGVNSNGIDFKLEKVNKNNNNNNNKIVFGYFGGKVSVKGYYFINKILLEYPNKDWEIVLIDTGRKFNYFSIKNDEWDNKAKIHGYIPHEKMDKIYQSIDVLLFPSEWNESFGLMVREAIANDVFVICSDCGGPTNAIKHRDNGLIFEKRNEQEFIKCLDYVFDNKEKIKNYHTTNYGDIRSFTEQANELHKIMEEILQG